MQPLIYHNPDCGAPRNTLAMIEASGEMPKVIEYFKTPPGRKPLTDRSPERVESAEAVSHRVNQSTH